MSHVRLTALARAVVRSLWSADIGSVFARDVPSQMTAGRANGSLWFEWELTQL